MSDDSHPLRRVILESPYAARTWIGRLGNKRYARACMRDSLLRGEAPLASHLLYTQKGILNDQVPHERALGVEAGLFWGEHAEATVVYTDRGISPGMMKGIAAARRAGRRVEQRSLYRDTYNQWDEEWFVRHGI